MTFYWLTANVASFIAGMLFMVMLALYVAAQK